MQGWVNLRHPNLHREQQHGSCWDGRPFGHNKHGPKSGGGVAVVPLSAGELGPHRAQCRLVVYSATTIIHFIAFSFYSLTYYNGILNRVLLVIPAGNCNRVPGSQNGQRCKSLPTGESVALPCGYEAAFDQTTRDGSPWERYRRRF